MADGWCQKDAHGGPADSGESKGAPEPLNDAQGLLGVLLLRLPAPLLAVLRLLELLRLLLFTLEVVVEVLLLLWKAGDCTT